MVKKRTDPLEDYRRKRDPEATPEPFGPSPSEALSESPSGLGAFVVHEHLATRKHYDLRIECGGVLQSFAVPRGPTLDPIEKHLAVRTEPHPIEYLDFEDVIPSGNYGAGPMIVWDRGTVTPLGKPLGEQLETTKLDFVLTGRKLRGRFSLVKLKGEEKNYLLLKKDDRFVQKGVVPTELYPESILSCLCVGELGQKAEIGASILDDASKLGHTADTRERAASEEATPTLLPWLLSNEATPPGELVWPWFEGVRVLVHRDYDFVTLTSDAGEDITGFYPDVVLSVLALAVPRFVLEGVLVVESEQAASSTFSLMQRATFVGLGDEHAALLHLPATLYVRTLLACGDASLVDAGARERASLLARFVKGRGVVRVLDSFGAEHRETLLAFAKAEGLPGVVSEGEGNVLFVPSKEGGSVPVSFLHAARISGASGSARSTKPSARNQAAANAASVVRVRTTNRSKIYFPELGLTKGDMLDYYGKVAPVLLPYLHKRPVLLTRYPDGIHGKSFFQWNVPPGLPSYIETYVMQGDPEKNRASRERRERRVFVVHDLESLTFVANLGAIALHLLPFRRGREAFCDYLVMDFDVKLSGLARAIPIACTLHQILDDVGLASYPKTSGQTGLHVVVPLGSGASDTTARKLAELLGALLVLQHPKDATMERVVADRGDKVYVDTGQTGNSRAIVAPYSLRPTPAATVSTPLTWDEVTLALDPKAFTLKTVPARLAQLSGRDLMADVLTAEVNLVSVLEKLATYGTP